MKTIMSHWTCDLCGLERKTGSGMQPSKWKGLYLVDTPLGNVFGTERHHVCEECARMVDEWLARDKREIPNSVQYEPYLGLARTGDLITELIARLDLNESLADTDDLPEGMVLAYIAYLRLMLSTLPANVLEYTTTGE